MSDKLPTLETVRQAQERLGGIANRTPIQRSRSLDERLEAEVFLKCENFQRSGSFKFRGAYNAISQLAPEERKRGVLTYSSGNHAQAMALAARLLGTRATVVMPRNAPESKRAAAISYGAEVIDYDPAAEVREDVAEGLRTARGLPLIPPFDHPNVIAGQGTAGLELLEFCGRLDLIFAPCGGGGLLSGTALAAQSVDGCKVIGVEPEVADDATRSFRTGRLHRVTNPPTIADGLRTSSMGVITWPLVHRLVSDMITVTEEQIGEAMRFLWTRMKLVVEPSGAVALAGLLADPALTRGQRVGVLVSGGNVDLGVACEQLTGNSI